MRVWQRADGSWSAEVEVRLRRRRRVARTHTDRAVVERWACEVEAAKLAPTHMREAAIAAALDRLPKARPWAWIRRAKEA